MKDKLDSLYKAISRRLKELPDGSCARGDVLGHLMALARFNAQPNDYPQVEKVEFPQSMHVAYAVCHPECGCREFIVDGSTQECQRCGALMFRTEVKEYQLKRTRSPALHRVARQK